MRLLVRADADPSMGAGHAMRCFALAQAWRDRGGAVTLAGAVPEGVARRFANEGAEILAGRADALTLGEMARARAADWVVIDGYHLGLDHQRAARAGGARVLVIDDDAVTREYEADAVLDANVFADGNGYERRAQHTQLWMGPAYALLRREFGSARAERPAPDVARRVLCSFGGADATRLSERAIDALQGHAGFDVVLLVGAANPRRKAIAGAIVDRPGMRVLYDATNVEELMAWADLAVVAAGSTCLELAHMGLPSLVIATADNQRRIAERFAQLGAMVSLGASEWVTARDLAAAIDGLAADAGARRQMAARARAIVDGRGSARVVAAMIDGSA